MKAEKFHRFFTKLEKHHFGPTLGTFQPKYLRTSKNQAVSIFKVDETQTLCRI